MLTKVKHLQARGGNRTSFPILIAPEARSVPGPDTGAGPADTAEMTTPGPTAAAAAAAATAAPPPAAEPVADAATAKLATNASLGTPSMSTIPFRKDALLSTT